MGRRELARIETDLETSPAGEQSDSMKKEQSPTPASADVVLTKELNRSDVEKRIAAEWSLIMNSTRFIPNYVDGRVQGFRITKLPEESILSEIGIQKNDIIKEINGIKKEDVVELVVSTIGSLYNVKRYQISIENVEELEK